MDTNVNSEVDMDLLVDDQPDEEKDYLDNVNKEPEKQDPDPDKVVEADLEMDPAAATEEDRQRRVEMMRMGLNPYTKSLEKLEVFDKLLDCETDYKTWNDFHNSPADKYAKDAMKKFFKYSSTIKPVTMEYYKKFEAKFNGMIFGTKLFDFKNKYMTEHMDKTVSVKISTKYYGTVSFDINFKRGGKITPAACVYALTFENGDPSYECIVPLMRVYEGCGEDYTSSESYKNAYSLEKAFGYFKRSDFKNEKGLQKYRSINSVDEFFNLPFVKEKIKLFTEDIKEKDYTPATIDEVRNLKSTFFNKYLRGATDSGNIIHKAITRIKYVKKYGFIWAYWIYPGLTPNIENLFVIGMVKTNKGKLTSVGFAMYVPMRKTADIVDLDKKSKEHFDFANAKYDFGL